MIHTLEMLIVVAITWLLGWLAGGYQAFWRRGGTHDFLMQTLRDTKRIRDLEEALDRAVDDNTGLLTVVDQQRERLLVQGRWSTVHSIDLDAPSPLASFDLPAPIANGGAEL